MKKYNDNILQHLKWQNNQAPNITALLNKKAEWREIYHNFFWDSWESNIYNIDTANQFGLIIWCIILGVSTDIINFDVKTQLFAFGKKRENFIYDEQYHDPQLPPEKQSKGGNFGNSEIVLSNLEDIRMLLKFRYATLVSNGRLQYMNRMLNLILNNGDPWKLQGQYLYDIKYAYAIDNTVKSPKNPDDPTKPYINANIFFDDWQGFRKVPFGPGTGRIEYLWPTTTFDNNYNEVFNCSYQRSNEIAPDGTISSQFVKPDEKLDSHKIKFAVHKKNVDTGTKYVTFSCFFATLGYRYVKINTRYFSSDDTVQLVSSVTYDINNQIITGTNDYKIIPYKNGWSRLILVINNDIGKGISNNYVTNQVEISILDNNQNEIFSGDNKSGILIFGWNLEAGKRFDYDYVSINVSNEITEWPDNVFSWQGNDPLVIFGRPPDGDPINTQIYWTGQYKYGGTIKPINIGKGVWTRKNYLISELKITRGGEITDPNYIEFRIGKYVKISDNLINLMNDRENGFIFQNAAINYKVVREDF